MAIIITILGSLDTHPETLSRSGVIEITDGVATYQLNVGGIPAVGDALTYLNSISAELWIEAVARAVPVDPFSLKERMVLKAFAGVVLDEINLLRTNAGLTPRTATQLRTAIKNKLGNGL